MRIFHDSIGLILGSPRWAASWSALVGTPWWVPGNDVCMMYRSPANWYGVGPNFLILRWTPVRLNKWLSHHWRTRVGSERWSELSLWSHSCLGGCRMGWFSHQKISIDSGFSHVLLWFSHYFLGNSSFEGLKSPSCVKMWSPLVHFTDMARMGTVEILCSIRGRITISGANQHAIPGLVN